MPDALVVRGAAQQTLAITVVLEDVTELRGPDGPEAAPHFAPEG